MGNPRHAAARKAERRGKAAAGAARSKLIAALGLAALAGVGAAVADPIEDRETLWTNCVREKALEYAAGNETAHDTARIAAVKCRIHKTAYIYLLAPPSSELTTPDDRKWAQEMADKSENFIVEAVTPVIMEYRLKANKLP